MAVPIFFMQELHAAVRALVEAMRFDVEEGNFSDVLLEKVTERKEGEKVIKEENRNSSFKQPLVK
jgi:hypothetical protein